MAFKKFRSWSRDVSSAPKTYQEIVLPDGVVVSGADRSYLHPLIFGEDFTGKSLLDLGSYHGHFCLEALRRGADRAVGIEPYTENLAYAREIAAKLGLAPDYVDADFETWETAETFDCVLCLNLLHHLYDPVHALRKLVPLARERIVIELAAPRWLDLRKKRIGPGALLARHEPILAPGRTRDLLAAADYTFIISPAAIKAIFEQHFACFESVRILPSPFKGRHIVVAEKRRIEDLTIVAGPTSSGKTTFIERLTASPELRRQAGIPQEVAAVVNATRLRQLPDGPLGHVILHYDLMRPFDRSLRTHQRDPATSLALAARRVTVLTLDPPRDRLAGQIKAANPNPSKRHLRLEKLYREPGFVDRWYQEWFAFVASIGARHLVVDPAEGYALRDA